MATSTQILRGLEIIEKYDPGTDVSAENDVIYAGAEDLLYKMTEEEAKTMVELGWYISAEFGCWYHHT